MEIKIADKCYVTDAENNTYIDTTMGSGAQIIGHNNPLIQEIGEQIKRNYLHNPQLPYQGCKLLPKKFINPDFSEQYIYCNSGTEANMRAIRLARAYTGKTLIGRFHGGWHGGLDGFLKNILAIEVCLQRPTDYLESCHIMKIAASRRLLPTWLP